MDKPTTTGLFYKKKTKRKEVMENVSLHYEDGCSGAFCFFLLFSSMLHFDFSLLPLQL
jgi:hypothetical protein